jgi:hypothetical protein
VLAHSNVLALEFPEYFLMVCLEIVKKPFWPELRQVFFSFR